MAVTKIFVISWQDSLSLRNNRGFKFKETALKFAGKILEQGHNTWLTELEYADDASLDLCVDNTGDFSPGPLPTG